MSCEKCGFDFVQELLQSDAVPSEHLTLSDYNLSTPMSNALANRDTQHAVQITLMLILRGVPMQPRDVHECQPARRQQILVEVKAILAADHAFFEVILGCGVHGSRDSPVIKKCQAHNNGQLPNHLLKLRGCGNIQARMLIGRALGVRSEAELVHLKSAQKLLESKH